MIDLPSAAPGGFTTPEPYLEFLGQQLADIRFLAYWAFVVLVMQLMIELVRLFQRRV